MPYRPAGTSAQAMTRKRRRLYLVGLALLSLGTATALMLTAFEDNLVFFLKPTDLVAKELAPGQRIQLGGLVEAGSVEGDPRTARIHFRVPDTARARQRVAWGKRRSDRVSFGGGQTL